MSTKETWMEEIKRKSKTGLSLAPCEAKEKMDNLGFDRSETSTYEKGVFTREVDGVTLTIMYELGSGEYIGVSESGNTMTFKTLREIEEFLNS